ncbi:hypothetical protein V6615_00860 [Oscillospiraceae bacterium PP1C4]
MNENMEKIKKLFDDEAFVGQMLSYEDPKEVQLALEEKGISISIDEIISIGHLLEKYQRGELSEEVLQKAADGELSDEELENVAGGSFIFMVILMVSLGVGLAAGAGGAAVGLRGVW